MHCEQGTQGHGEVLFGVGGVHGSNEAAQGDVEEFLDDLKADDALSECSSAFRMSCEAIRLLAGAVWSKEYTKISVSRKNLLSSFIHLFPGEASSRVDVFEALH